MAYVTHAQAIAKFAEYMTDYANGRECYENTRHYVECLSTISKNGKNSRRELDYYRMYFESEFAVLIVGPGFCTDPILAKIKWRELKDTNLED